MKRWIIGLLIVAVVAGGAVYWVSQIKIDLPGLAGETAIAERKTLSIPIKATGLIEPAAPPIEIKSKASGEVAKIYVKAGDIVKKDQLLLELDPKDEQRNVERAEAEMNRAKATLEKARVALKQQTDDYPINKERATAAVAHAEATLAQLQYELDEQERMLASGAGSEKAVSNSRNFRNQGLAQVNQMKAELKRIVNTSALIDLAEQDVALAQAAYQSAKKTWEDAKERLVETKRYSPIDGMVTKINIRRGELIMSGTTSLTGGTVLMTLADISDLYVTAQVDEADISAVLELAPAQARPGVQRVEAMLQQNLSASAAEGEVSHQALVKALTTAPASQPSVSLPGGVEKGKPVKIRVEAFREEEFTGIIEHIAPEPLRQSSVVTYDVRIRLMSPNRYKLLLGMQADAEFTSESINAVVVPIDAVKSQAADMPGGRGERGVWIPVDNGGPVPGKKWQPCRFGLDDASYVEVISGLKEGDKVFKRLPPDMNRGG